MIARITSPVIAFAARGSTPTSKPPSAMADAAWLGDGTSARAAARWMSAATTRSAAASGRTYGSRASTLLLESLHQSPAVARARATQPRYLRLDCDENRPSVLTDSNNRVTAA